MLFYWCKIAVIEAYPGSGQLAQCMQWRWEKWNADFKWGYWHNSISISGHWNSSVKLLTNSRGKQASRGVTLQIKESSEAKKKGDEIASTSTNLTISYIKISCPNKLVTVSILSVACWEQPKKLRGLRAYCWWLGKCHDQIWYRNCTYAVLKWCHLPERNQRTQKGKLDFFFLLFFLSKD